MLSIDLAFVSYKIQYQKDLMLRGRDNPSYAKKYIPNMSPQPMKYLQNVSDTSYKQRFETLTLESRYSKAPYLNEQGFSSSSRIAQEQDCLPNNYDSFQASILQKVENIEEQTNLLLQKKERELYFLKIELRNSDERVRQREEALRQRQDQVRFLQYQISILKKGPPKEPQNQGNEMLKIQNQRLKESLRILIEQKNQMTKMQNKLQHNSIFSSANVSNLKREVEELRTMVAEMENMVYRCPSCYTLKRQIQQLTEAYNCLLSEHSELKKLKRQKEENLLINITQQIQQNQNILRDNAHLRKEQPGKSYFRPKREKLNESVAKRCRTLTDQF